MNRWLLAVLAALLVLTGGIGTPALLEASVAEAQARQQSAPNRPAARATTRGLEEALRRTETEAAPERQAPARLPDDDGEVSRDALADQRRDEEIEALMRVLPRQRVPETRAELLFRLAELWWEKSKYVYLAEEMPEYQAARNAWFECITEKGESACDSEPILNNRKSEVYRNNAVQLYEQITQEHPEYRRNDEVRYILAYNKYELGQTTEGPVGERAMAEAVEQYRMLINLHPRSPFVADAYMQLGNHYFDRNQLVQARKAFEECVKLESEQTQTYCIYKLAWCDINSGDQLAAVERFKTVIDRAQSTGESASRIRLGGEALRDIIGPFSQLDEDQLSDREKINYLIQVAGQQGSREYIAALASVYFNAGRYDQSINIYRYMLGEHPFDPNAPEWQSRIVLAYDKLNRRDLVLEEMERLVEAYRPNSNWAKTNASNKAAINVALSLTEEALYNLVTDYHQEAIKTKTVKTYQLARDIYGQYVENFPDSERSYQMRYYYAEILFALEDFQPAYQQYRLVAQDDREDYKKVAAENMLLAASRLVCLEQGRCELTIDENHTRIDEGKARGSIERRAIMKVDKDASEQPLTDLETQFVKACDEYVELVPNASDEAEVRLAAAVTFFEKAHYLEAADRFGYIINRWPEDRSSSTAAAYVLESLEIKEEWVALNRLAREFAGNKRLLAGKGKAEFRAQLPVYIEGSQFNHAMEVYTEEKDYPQAAKLFRDFVDEFKESKYAPVALYNAFVIFNQAEELDTAIAMAEQLLAGYPKVDESEWRKLPSGDERDPLLPLLIFDLGKAYERIADFANAARYYERFAADFPSDPRAPDAQYNAGYWYQGLGEYAKAISAYEKYIAAYRRAPASVREELAPDAAIFFEIARIHELQKDWRGAAAKYDEYTRVYRNEDGWKIQNALYRRFLALLEQDRTNEANQLATRLVRGYEALSDDDKERETSRLSAAHARFYQLEPQFEAYTRIRFDSPNTLQRRLQQKIETMASLRQAYEEVVNYRNGDYAIASLVRIASLPRDFARSLLEAPIPPGLNWEQEELYRSILESEAMKYEEPAIDALETAVSTSFELGIYNSWGIQAQNALSEFMPNAFGEIRQLPLHSAEFFFVHDPLASVAAEVDEGAGGDGGQ